MAHPPQVLMSSARKELVARFQQDILAGKRQSHDTLFRTLYGIPAALQIELARYMTARYLPIFRSHRTDLRWVDSVLADVDAYFGPHGRGLPEATPADLIPGDIQFTTCVFLLADAWRYAHRNEQGELTAICGSIVIDAVAARAANVWRADDPEAVQAFETDDTDHWVGRTSQDNVASRAVRQREWLVVASWLDEHAIGSHPAIPDSEVAEREKALVAWQDREYLF